MTNFVMARAFRGEPLCRVAVDHGNGLIYIANPARLDSVRKGESFPVGFPKEDVFTYDEQIFRRLRDQWEERGTTDPELWQKALPYEVGSRQRRPVA